MGQRELMERAALAVAGRLGWSRAEAFALTARQLVRTLSLLDPR